MQNITLSATGTTDDVMTGSTSTSTTTIGDEAWAGLNLSAANVALLNALLTNSSVAANAQNISMSATGGTNIYSAGIITDTDNLSNVSFTSGVNTITSSGTNVEITADGVTTIDPASNPANTYNVTLTGDTMSANTQHVDVVDLSKLWPGDRFFRRYSHQST